ncbi:MAG: amino acid permease [Oscillatoriales cyanobacterium]|nr:MAG: amino acid permease [Oscillatoriales cyanobacterium]
MTQLPLPNFVLRRSLGTLETWGFGFSGLLLWLGTAPAMNAALGPAAMWVWMPGAMIGVLLNLQVKRLGMHHPDISGGTPNYMTILLDHYPLLARYGAIGYWLGWISVPPMNAIILTNLIQENLATIGWSFDVMPWRVGFTLLPFIVAFSNTRTIGILHSFFVIPAIGFLATFCIQGLGWLATSPHGPGLFPESFSGVGVIDWAKWFFIAVYAVYGCETASSFVSDSRKPRKTLECLGVAAITIPLVYVVGSWILAKLATSGELGDSAYLNLTAAARPFWGNAASGLVTFLIASGCLLSSATAVSNCPRILYQLAKDRHLPALFTVVSPRGVIEPSLVFTLLMSLVCLVWGDIARVVMVTGTGYLASMLAIHWGLWLQRHRSDSLWPRWSLAFCLLEAVVLVVGGIAWSWQDWIVGLLLPLVILALATLAPCLPLAIFNLTWWQKRYRHQANVPRKDWVVFQVVTLLLLLCGAVTIGWFTRASLAKFGFGDHGAIFSIVLITVAFVGVAIAAWTTLSQMSAITEAREQIEQTLQELQQTQSQLVQTEKMSSLGQLVAGIAHEINNPVNFIYGNLEHIREYNRDLFRVLNLYRHYYPNPPQEIVDEIERVEVDFMELDSVKILNSMKLGSDRIREIVLSLRNFSRLDEAELKAVNIHEGIDSTLIILKHRLKAKAHRPAIKVIKHYSDLPPVECYPSQLNQVVMNIIGNAIDALEEVSDNRSYDDLETHPNEIHLFTSLFTVTNEQQIEVPWAEIAIADNGPGIPPEIQQRIFDPFFTTKPIGKGTGMGMSISYQIIAQKHGGQIECVSSPQQGTKFAIRIPLKQPTLSDNANAMLPTAIYR